MRRRPLPAVPGAVEPMPRSIEGSARAAPALADHADFLVPGVSVIAASRDARNLPSVTRGLACRVSADRSTLTVLLRRSQAAAVLADVEAGGWITTCHSQPSTHRTIQLKGEDARILPPADDDWALVDRFVDGFCGELAPLGYTEAFVRALLHCPAGDLVAVCFTPREIYSQTPGPNAGARVA